MASGGPLFTGEKGRKSAGGCKGAPPVADEATAAAGQRHERWTRMRPARQCRNLDCGPRNPQGPAAVHIRRAAGLVNCYRLVLPVCQTGVVPGQFARKVWWQLRWNLCIQCRTDCLRLFALAVPGSRGRCPPGRFRGVQRGNRNPLWRFLFGVFHLSLCRAKRIGGTYTFLKEYL